MLLKQSLGLCLGLVLLCTQLQAQSITTARQLLEKEQYAQAQQELEQVLEKEPDAQEAQLLLGQAHYHQSQFDKAIKVLKPLRNSMKTRADLQYWLGQSYKGKLLATENFLEKGVLSSKVKEYLEKAIDLDPKHTDARESIAFFYFSAPGIVGGSKKKAFQQVEAIKALDARRSHILAGNLYRQNKDYPAAITAYQTLAEMEPEEANWPFLLGFCYQMTPDYARAFSSFERAINLDDKKAGAYYQFARTGVLSKQRTNQCIGYMQYFLKLNDPKSYPRASAYWRLGMLYEIKGEKEKARAAYDQGLELDPEDEKLLKARKALKE